tara:strand:- start:277 stop:690 length:414 start_codon:yes stop_codon:yes gene_type:complete
VENKIKKNQRTAKKRVNIIPLIDIIFLLLIFFMLATNFNQNQNVDFSTPEKLTESNSDSNIILDLKIQNNGYFLLDGLTFKNEKELKENILIKWDKKKYSGILITTEKDVILQNLITTLDIVKSIGISDVSFSGPLE